MRNPAKPMMPKKWALVDRKLHFGAQCTKPRDGPGAVGEGPPPRDAKPPKPAGEEPSPPPAADPMDVMEDPWEKCTKEGGECQACHDCHMTAHEECASKKEEELIGLIKEYFEENAYDMCLEKFDECAPPPHGAGEFNEDCEICGGYVDLFFTHFDFEAHFAGCEDVMMQCEEGPCVPCHECFQEAEEAMAAGYVEENEDFEDEWSMDAAQMEDPFLDCYAPTEANDGVPICSDCDACHDEAFMGTCANLEQQIVEEVVTYLHEKDEEHCGYESTVVPECAPPPHGNANWEAPICQHCMPMAEEFLSTFDFEAHFGQCDDAHMECEEGPACEPCHACFEDGQEEIIEGESPDDMGDDLEDTFVEGSPPPAELPPVLSQIERANLVKGWAKLAASMEHFTYHQGVEKAKKASKKTAKAKKAKVSLCKLEKALLYAAKKSKHAKAKAKVVRKHSFLGQ